MNRVLGLTLLAVALPFSACRDGVTSPPAVASIEGAIYSAVLDSLFDHSWPEPLVVQNRTLVADFANVGSAALLAEIEDVAPELVSNFREKGAERTPIAALPGAPVTVLLVSETELETIFRDGSDGWDEFRRRYPGARGFVGFTRVGFSADSTQALVSVEWRCGSLCGVGHLGFLVRQGGDEWRIREFRLLWIS
jgi:hypothetical protein